MQMDPMENWRRLSRHYAEMTDGELINLAADFEDLTSEARQVLRDEMKKRGLGDPETIRAEEISEVQDAGAGKPSTTYVWKNLLCECEGQEQARQITEVLRRAGIESWIDGSAGYSPFLQQEMSNQRLRVLVASDQLEEARMIAAQPIPQDIVYESTARQREFELPTCPSCGAPDPVLEGVDPANTWRCEVCGKEWTESVEEAGEATGD